MLPFSLACLSSTPELKERGILGICHYCWFFSFSSNAKLVCPKPTVWIMPLRVLLNLRSFATWVKGSHWDTVPPWRKAVSCFVFGLCLCGCACLCGFPVEAAGQCWLVPSVVVYLISDRSLTDPGAPWFECWGYRCPPLYLTFMGVLGIWTQYLCSYSRHCTDWFIFPAPN